MARLATFVHVPTERGGHEIFGPDDEVPDWAVPLITPAAWADGEIPSASRLAEPVKAPAKRAAPRRKAATSDDAVHSG